MLACPIVHPQKNIEQKPTRKECVFQSTDCDIEQLKLKLNTVKTFTCHFTRLLFFACFPQYGQGKMSFLIFSELEQMSQITCTSTWDFLINKLEQNIYFELLAGWWQLKHCKNCAICPSEVFWKVKFLCQFCFSCPVCPNVHKQVGDCQISYNLQLSCVR